MYTHKIFKGKIFQTFVPVQSSRKYQIWEFQCGTPYFVAITLATHQSESLYGKALFTELKVFYTTTATLGENLTYDSEIINKA